MLKPCTNSPAPILLFYSVLTGVEHRSHAYQAHFLFLKRGINITFPPTLKLILTLEVKYSTLELPSWLATALRLSRRQCRRQNLSLALRVDAPQTPSFLHTTCEASGISPECGPGPPQSLSYIGVLKPDFLMTKRKQLLARTLWAYCRWTERHCHMFWALKHGKTFPSLASKSYLRTDTALENIPKVTCYVFKYNNIN